MRVAGKLSELTCNQVQLAEYFGLSKARISQLVEEGLVPRDEVNKTTGVMLADSIRNYYSSKNVSGGVDFWREKGLHEKAKRELSELKLQKELGNLYEASTVEAAFIEMLATLRTQLLGLPAKFALQLEGKTREEIYEVMTAEIETLLTELSESYATGLTDQD